MSQKKNIFYCLSIFSAFLMVSCANPVTPEGGPKDVKPPVVLLCDPANRTVKFNTNSIRIVFDEFINLKNPLSEIFISPPLRERLDPKLRGKSLVIKINDSLAAFTTYSISFGNAISDITENNILRDFTYVFSTGDYIDSLSLRGNLLNAFDHIPQKDVFAELYINNNDTLPFDSLPLKLPPYYVTKTDEKGNFIFNNLKKNDFLLFALSDQNGDLIFNQPSEKIAFSDTLVKSYFIVPPKIDSAKKDTVIAIKPKENSPKKLDSIRISDSIHKIDSLKKMELLYPFYTLYLFEEIDSAQRLINSRFPREGLAMLFFRYPVHDLHIVPLNFDSISTWRVDEYSPKKDTIFLWLTRPKIDTLIARMVIDGKLIDTLRLNLVRKATSRKTDKKTTGTHLEFQNSASGSGLNQFKNKVELIASYPLARWDLSRVLLIEDKDTLKAKLEFTDSIKRHLLVNHKWKEETNYKLIIPDSVFFSITGISHDSIIQTFRTKAERDFGNLIVTLNIDHQPGQYIVQLLNEKETSIIEEHIVTQSGKIKMNYISPGQFKLKAILDRNKNRKWDTGNYRSRLQPEKVFYFPKNIEIRSNWDVEENWEL
ncbi:MAG: Ig-like domain-containing protein [Bacteroidales bacterium]|nr:Ig-like domain-containing protein [Bacteroidales bacterium]